MNLPPYLALATALALSLGFALADDEPAPKGDLARLQGTWTARVGPNQDFEIETLIKGKTVTVKGTTPDGQDFALTGELKLDEKAKPHKTIDWVKFRGPNGDPILDNLGIYEFDGDDKLKTCNGGPGNDRPTEFKDQAGGPPSTLVLTRKKEKPAAR